MTHATRSVSACRRCSYYRSEGRRGGQCDLLGASVQGQWSACAAAQALFELPIAPSVSAKAIALEAMITTLKVVTDASEPALPENADCYETSLGELEDAREAIGDLVLFSGLR